MNHDAYNFRKDGVSVVVCVGSRRCRRLRPSPDATLFYRHSIIVYVGSLLSWLLTNDPVDMD